MRDWGSNKSFLLFHTKEKGVDINIYKPFILVGHGLVCVMSKPWHSTI